MSNDPAKARYFAIQALRWSGLVLVLLGLVVLNGKLDWPVEVGYVLTVVGLLDALIMPSMLAKRWKSPPQ